MIVPTTSKQGASLVLPVRQSYLPYGRQSIDEADIEAVTAVLRSDYLTTGPMIPELERKFARLTGAKYAVAYNSGTAALHAACKAAGIGEGDEVITTAMTFAASANCILYEGGTPVFADIDERTYNLDPASVEACLTPRTKAIIAVDYTGQPAPLAELKAIAERWGLVLIEDAAHALGASYRGSRIGSISDMTMFSLHPVKHVTAGEGGIVTTDNETYYHQLLLFRNHGMVRDPEKLEVKGRPSWYYEVQSLGYNYRLTDFQAALAISQLDKLDTFVAKRKAIADAYNEAFRELPGFTVPYQETDGLSSWHLYVIELDSEVLGMSRDTIYDRLQQARIGVNLHYIPVYLHPYYRQLGYKPGLCPIAERHYERMLTLPLFPAMTEQDVADVIQAVRSVTENDSAKAVPE